MRIKTSLAVALFVVASGVRAGGDSCPCAAELSKGFQDCAKERHDLKAAQAELPQAACDSCCGECIAFAEPEPCPACPEVKPRVVERFVYLDPGQEPASWHPAVGVSVLNRAGLLHGGVERRGPNFHLLLLGTVGRVNPSGEEVGVFKDKHPQTDKWGKNDFEPAGTREAGGESETLYGVTGVVTW